MVKRTQVEIDQEILERFEEARMENAAKVSVTYKPDLKPVLKEDVVKALKAKPDYLACNPRQAARVAKFAGEQVTVRTGRSIAPCELWAVKEKPLKQIEAERQKEEAMAVQFRRWLTEAREKTIIDEEGNEVVKSGRKHSRDMLPVTVKAVQKLITDNPGWESTDVVKYYKKHKKLHMSKAQVDRMLEGKALRGYVRAKIMK